MKKTEWLSQDIAPQGFKLCLCLSDEEYRRAMAECNTQPIAEWVSTPQADATLHTFDEPGAGPVAIVCVGNAAGKSGIQIAALLVHEAVHIWQKYCAYIGESNPGHEQEAYAVQILSQTLMCQYAAKLSNPP
jgi:hypothetical protein